MYASGATICYNLLFILCNCNGAGAITEPVLGARAGPPPDAVFTSSASVIGSTSGSKVLSFSDSGRGFKFKKYLVNLVGFELWSLAP